jgi:transcriptional regulator with XRE-family HTH domain
MEIVEKICNHIKAERKKQGLSQEGLAMKSEIDRAYMSSIENGQRNISIQILYQITSKGLNKSMADFFNEINL